MKQLQTFKAACLQYNPQLGERTENINGLLQLTKEAAMAGAKFIVTPEMATTGYYFEDREAVAKVIDTIPGQTTNQFAEIAREYQCYIVVGMPEVDTDTNLYYNSAALVGPNGYIGKYRKVHLWEIEAHWAVPGDLGVPVYQTEIGKIAINICMDIIYFESARLAALGGAELLAFPTNSSAQTISFLQERAESNGMYIISANRSNNECGFQMFGGSAIWSPSGKKVAEAPFSAEMADENLSYILYGEIDKSRYVNQSKARLRERRPEIYKELKLHIAPWNSRKTMKSNHVTLVAIQQVKEEKSHEERFHHYKEQIESLSEINLSSPVLVVLPELSITGTVDHLSADEIYRIALHEKAPLVSIYQQLAKELMIHLVIGLVEKDGNALYNTAMLIDDTGNICGKYRKTHLTGVERKWATKGGELPVFQCEKLGRIGILIGYDAAFPETAGVLTIKRADIIAIPSDWQGEFGCNLDRKAVNDDQVYFTTWDSLSQCFQAYTVVSSWIDTKKPVNVGSGVYTLDAVYGTDQPIIATNNERCIVKADVSTLKLECWFNQEKIIHSRRIEHYTPLISEKKASYLD